MTKLRVGVVRGGPSSEYDVSLKTGATILQYLNTEKYQPIDILLTRKLEWVMDGLLVDLAAIAQSVDVLWNAMHGEFGEDGKAQRMFEQFNIPYTGSGVLPSALGMNKILTKQRLTDLGIRTPSGEVVEGGDDVEERVFDIFRSYKLPVVIKPATLGSSIGVTIAHNFDELMRGVEAARVYGSVIIEEHIAGKEATCAVVDGEKGELYVLPPIEIVPAQNHPFFDYASKYEQNGAKEICPGNFTEEETVAIRKTAAAVHRGLGLRHYSRTDMIVSPRGIYVLEANTLPGMTAESLLPKALKAANIELSEFIEYILALALKN